MSNVRWKWICLVAIVIGAAFSVVVGKLVGIYLEKKAENRVI